MIHLAPRLFVSTAARHFPSVADVHRKAGYRRVGRHVILMVG